MTGEMAPPAIYSGYFHTELRKKPEIFLWGNQSRALEAHNLQENSGLKVFKLSYGSLRPPIDRPHTRAWVQSETRTDAHSGRGGDWEKCSFIRVPGNHICGACVHVYIMIIESQLTTLPRSNSPSLFISLSSWGCVVEASWIAASLNSSPSLPTLPPPTHCHIKPDLQKLTAGSLRVCVVALAKWQRGDTWEGDGERKARLQLREEMVKNTWVDSVHADGGRQGKKRGGASRKESSWREGWYKAEIWTPAKLL